MEIKNNFNIDFELLCNSLKENNTRPKLLLHACCGPCFTYPYELLKDYFDITIIYNNSNIYPEEEYRRRLSELKNYVISIADNIEVIEFPYDNETYNLDLEPYKDDYEGNERCRICFRKRLSFGFKYASDHNFDYFGTVMTISRYKNSQDINSIGFELEKQFPNVHWLPADFKKKDGYQKSLQIVKSANMYFQHYCGCKYSYSSFMKKNENK